MTGCIKTMHDPGSIKSDEGDRQQGFHACATKSRGVRRLQPQNPYIPKISFYSKNSSSECTVRPLKDPEVRFAPTILNIIRRPCFHRGTLRIWQLAENTHLFADQQALSHRQVAAWLHGGYE